MARKPLPEALTREQIEAKLAVIADDNAAAESALQAVCNDAARWDKLQAQARTQGLDAAQFTALCGKMLRTRREWTHCAETQRERLAFHGLLIALGSAPTAEDEAAFDPLTQ